MIRIPGRIPVSIYPSFWIVAALIAYFEGQSLGAMFAWMLIIFISVLFHEFGHALTSLFFKKNPRIELVAMGGVTYHEGENLSFPKQFLIVLNGPLFGFLLYLLAEVLLPFVSEDRVNLFAALKAMSWVNLYWTALNLLPILPLDGGQLLRIFCEGVWGVRGFKYALFTSMAVATLLSMVCFLFQQLLGGAILFLLAFQSFDTWRKSRLLSEQDRNENLKKELAQAEIALHAGRAEEARAALESIRTRAKKGMIFLLTSEYLAYLNYEEGHPKKAYELLLPLRQELSSDALCLLHKAAFDQKDYRLVIDIGGDCYRIWSSVETALHNAFACAALKQAEAAAGWIKTAREEGLENLEEVLKDPIFDAVRKDPAFKAPKRMDEVD